MRNQVRSYKKNVSGCLQGNNTGTNFSIRYEINLNGIFNGIPIKIFALKIFWHSAIFIAFKDEGEMFFSDYQVGKLRLIKISLCTQRASIKGVEDRFAYLKTRTVK